MKRVCLLTGAGGTLGSAFCRAHAGDYDIVAVYRDRAPDCLHAGDRLVDPLNVELEIPQNSVFMVHAELTDRYEIERVVDLALARFSRVDLLLNAAVHSRWGSLTQTEFILNEAAQQFEVNVLVPARLAVVMARRFWRDRDTENRKWNRNIINLSSTAGHEYYPGSGQSIYAASKAALNMLTQHMAEEFGVFGVRVNALAPNSFPAMVPIDDVLDEVIKLDHGSITGSIVVLDQSA
jgi:NAD(P)-dependent dehydrogenase (short-subunit alcohol dehydrogenase family)